MWAGRAVSLFAPGAGREPSPSIGTRPPCSRSHGLARACPAPPCPADAVLLNNIVQNFGMLDLVKKVLASHKCQMDRSREQYARDLAGTLAALSREGELFPRECRRPAGSRT